MARVVNPTTAPHVVTGRIVAHVAGTPDVVYIEDPDGDFLGAINAGGIVTVFAHYDATLNGSQVHTSGRWTTAPAHASGTTTFTASGSVFEDYMVGWQIQPDARYPVFFEITSVDGAELTVRGDLESQVPNLESEAVHYILIPPVGIDRTTGANDTSFAAPTSRYLAFGYHYIPPVAGVSIDDTTFGAQPGNSLGGMYYSWGNLYIPNTGRLLQTQPTDGGAATTPVAKPPRLVGPIQDGGHDRPVGGIILILPGECQPVILIRDFVDDEYGDGISEGLTKRNKWHATGGVQPCAGGGGMGAQRYCDSQLPHNVVGFAYVVAIVLIWDCDCTFKSYQQYKKPGDEPDNYPKADGSQDATGATNVQHMSSVKKTKSDASRCYRVFVDSPGSFSKQRIPYAQDKSYSWSVALKGVLTVTKDQKDYSAEEHWLVRARLENGKADGEYQRTGAINHHPDTPPSEGEDVPPSWKPPAAPDND